MSDIVLDIGTIEKELEPKRDLINKYLDDQASLLSRCPKETSMKPNNLKLVGNFEKRKSSRRLSNNFAKRLSLKIDVRGGLFKKGRDSGIILGNGVTIKFDDQADQPLSAVQTPHNERLETVDSVPNVSSEVDHDAPPVPPVRRELNPETDYMTNETILEGHEDQSSFTFDVDAFNILITQPDPFELDQMDSLEEDINNSCNGFYLPHYIYY